MSTNSPMPLYPVALRLEGRNCLVVGGGPVGARKIEALLACGAIVTVVAPQVDRRIVEMERTRADHITAGAGPAGTPPSGELTVERRCYSSGEAARYQLVIAATGDPEVDQAVSEDCEAAGVWVNSVDGPELCSFFVPAVHRSGPVVVAVSTGGASPSLAGWIRDELRSCVGPEYAAVAGLLARAREELREQGRPTASIDWKALLALDLAAILRNDGQAAAREAVRSWLLEQGSGAKSSSPASQQPDGRELQS